MQMDLFTIIALAMALAGAVWALEIFTLGKRRVSLASELATSGETVEKIEAAMAEPEYNVWLRWIFLALLLPLLYFAIRRAMDFAVILVLATAITGAIYLADVLFLRKYRLKVLEALNAEKDEEDELERTEIEPPLVEYSRSFFPVLLVVLVLRSFIVEPYQIPSGSMRPTLEVGDFIAVNKFAYGFRLPILGTEIIPVAKPKTGDIIVFKPPHEPEKTYIKRVIATPGDHVRYDYRTKRLWLNGEEITSTLISTNIINGEGNLVLNEDLLGFEHIIYKQDSIGYPHAGEWIPKDGFVVPEGKYFAMGDNRDRSLDSRYWQFLDEDKILGKAFIVWMHWELKGISLESLPSFGSTGFIE